MANMKISIDWKLIGRELRRHFPFTVFGALTGIVFMAIIFGGGFLQALAPHEKTIFYVLHPAHIVLSAVVTTSIYKLRGGGKLWAAILIGFTGAVGIATLHDSILPYGAELLLKLPNTGIHIGFIEEPLITIPPAFIGIAIGYWFPTTKVPHAGHILISTWASLFHIFMALGQTVSLFQGFAIFLILFFSVWIICCFSDIVYPLLFVRKGEAHHHHHH
jgi:hypothetical protein